MTRELNYEGFEEFLDSVNDLYDGIQYVFHFNNGFGASVVKHRFSYGSENDNWELAVLKRSVRNHDNWKLCYDTHITNDVEGNLTDEDVQNLLKEIQEL